MGKPSTVSGVRFGDQGRLSCHGNNTCVWNPTAALLLAPHVTSSGHLTSSSLALSCFKDKRRPRSCLRSQAPQTCYVSSKCCSYRAFNTAKIRCRPCEYPLACGEKSLSKWKHLINGIKRRNELRDPSDLIFHGELNVGDVQFGVFFNLLFPAPTEISVIIYYNEIQSHSQA